MKKSVGKIVKELRKLHGKSKPPVVQGHPALFKLLIRTILSARNTDENALAAAKELFSKYKTPKQIAEAPLADIKKRIKRGVFFNVKARNIKKLSQILVKEYNGRVPKTMEELVKLPAVGRKTAGIVLIYGSGIVENIPIDTHCHRVLNRIGIVTEKTPEKTESAAMKAIPKRYWRDVNRLFVMHGRTVCIARKPKCSECPVKKWCNYYRNVFLKQKK